MPKSPGVRKEEKLENQDPQTEYTEDEKKQIGFILRRAMQARDIKEQPNEFLDDQTFTNDFHSNRRAMNSHLRPKKNDQEIRIVTGTPEKKVEVVVNELLAMNFIGEITAFDKDDSEVVELGDSMTGIVTRTNQIERDDNIKLHFLLQLVSQRAVFVEDYLDVRTVDNKIGGKWQPYTEIVLRKRIRSALKVLLGDITIPSHRFKDQPYYCIYDRTTYWEAETIFGDSPKWKDVVKGSGNGMSKDLSNIDINGGFRLGELTKDEVEIVYYYSYPDDEYQVCVNGVPMYEIGSPLESDHEGYNMRQFGLKPMDPDYTYCKPLIASAKILGALDNEMIRMLIQQWRQILKPAIGVTKNYSRDIFEPGRQTVGIREKDIHVLTQHKNIGTGEIAIYDLINKKTEEFIGQGTLQQAQSSPGSQTATEILELQRQATKSLGLAVFAYMSFIRDMTYLRVESVMHNFLEPVSKKYNPITKEVEDIYRKFTLLNTEIGNGKMGKKEISFTNKNPNKEELSKLKEDEDRGDRIGKPFRKVLINVDNIRAIPLKWFVTVVEKPKEGTPLDQAIFSSRLNVAVAISQATGQPLQGERINEDFEKVHKVKGWIGKAGQVSAPGQGGQGDPGVKADADKLMKEIESGIPEPGLKQLANKS